MLARLLNVRSVGTLITIQVGDDLVDGHCNVFIVDDEDSITVSISVWVSVARWALHQSWLAAYDDNKYFVDLERTSLMRDIDW